MDADAVRNLLVEWRTFALSWGEHDPDCEAIPFLWGPADRVSEKDERCSAASSSG